MRRGVFVAPFDELSDPRVVAGLAARAEDRGWDGFFVWDHTVYREPVRGVANAWVTLAAVACATERVMLGPLVTPLARRRVWNVAREAVGLQQLSSGRLVLGVGLGSDSSGELSPFGEEIDDRRRAALLDEGLERLGEMWSGEPVAAFGGARFAPTPDPRIPLWAAARWPAKRPVRRAAQLDGLFPIELEPAQLATYLDVVREQRGDLDGFDVVATGGDRAAWEAAGASWWLRGFAATQTRAEVEAAIDAG